MLEAGQHSASCFLTLTYADEHLPTNSRGMPTLVPKDLSDWLKRFRKAISPLLVRFYATGEYGDDNFRPHYHAAVFGYPNCSQFGTIYRRDGTIRCCEHCKLVHATWGKGLVHVGELNTSSAQYVAGYVTKKMTRTDDPRLDGRWPEFATMSRMPGIGKSAMYEVADTLMRFNLDKTQTDVPVSLRHGARELPLGRYLRNQLRLMIGKEAKAPEKAIKDQAEEMRPLLEAAKLDENNPSLGSQIRLENKGRRMRMEALAKIRKQRKRL